MFQRIKEAVVAKMKEIHAYINEDGTYRVEGVGYATDNGELREVAVIIPRAKIDIEALAAQDSGKIYSIEVKESSNENN